MKIEIEMVVIMDMDIDKNMNMKEYHFWNKALYWLIALSNLQLVHKFIRCEIYHTVLKIYFFVIFAD
jgi:hypothetical protein